jgi:hypothetical protein
MLADALHLMIEARVRRLFLEDEPMNYISDRSILALLFSPYMLEVARDSPAKWLDLRVSQLPRRRAIPVGAGASIGDGARLLSQGSDECLVTSKNRIVTRWDLVIKTWKKDLDIAAAPSLKPRARDRVSSSLH